MEQIVILILFVIGSIVSTIIQNKKKREAEAHGAEDSAPSPRRPFEQWPQTPADWQEELRRLFDQEKKAPPVIPPAAKPPPVVVPTRRVFPEPVVEKSEGDEEFASPFKVSDAAFSRASGLHARVREQMRSIDRAMHAHKPNRIPRRAVAVSPLTRWTRNPQALREAFIASLIFSPPVALTPPANND